MNAYTGDQLRAAAVALHRAAELLTPAAPAHAYVIAARDAVAGLLAPPADKAVALPRRLTVE